MKLTKDEKEDLYNIIDDIQREDVNQLFKFDVDWKRCPEIRHYPKIVKKPMCLNKVRNKVKLGKYKTEEECFAEIQLIWDNCKLFNQESSEIYKIAIQLEKRSGEIIRQFKNERDGNNLSVKTLTENSVDLEAENKLTNEKIKMKEEIKSDLEFAEDLSLPTSEEKKLINFKISSLNSDEAFKENYPQSLIAKEKRILVKVCRFNKSIYKQLLKYNYF